MTSIISTEMSRASQLSNGDGESRRSSTSFNGGVDCPQVSRYQSPQLHPPVLGHIDDLVDTLDHGDTVCACGAATH
jgi:hypothetical protein